MVLTRRSKPQRSAVARKAPQRLIQVVSPVKAEGETKPALVDEAKAKTKTDVLRHKRKKELDANENLRNEYDRALGTFKGQISRFRQEQQMLMAYDAEGWKGASREKLKPHAELTKARDKITRCLQIMRECVRICDEAGGDKAIPQECFDEEGEVDCNDIFCGKCRASDSTDDNDIIMCDGMCDRAYHMKCVFPPLDASILEDDSEEGWLCPACDRKIDMIDELNDEFGTDYEYDDAWEKILTPETLPTDHDLYDFRTADECENGTRSGRSSKSWLDGVELPSDGDESDEDFNGDVGDAGDDEDVGEGDDEGGDFGGADDEAGRKSSSPTSSSGASDSSDSDSECCSEDLDGAASIEDVDTSGLAQLNGKKDVGREELYKLLENDEPELVDGKRKRDRVDYRALNQELFGDVDGTPDMKVKGHASSSDDESDCVWSPSKKNSKTPLSD